MGWMVWLQIIFLLCMVWFGFGAVLEPLAALARTHVCVGREECAPVLVPTVHANAPKLFFAATTLERIIASTVRTTRAESVYVRVLCNTALGAMR
jgi:hypothetical protein